MDLILLRLTGLTLLAADNARPGRVRHVGARPTAARGSCRGICRQARVTTSGPPAGVGGCVGLAGVGRVGPRRRGIRRGHVGRERPQTRGCDSPTLGKHGSLHAQVRRSRPSPRPAAALPAAMHHAGAAGALLARKHPGSDARLDLAGQHRPSLRSVQMSWQVFALANRPDPAMLMW
jgi:hypothetical protein